MSVLYEKQLIRRSMQELLAGLSDEEKNNQSEVIRVSLHKMMLSKKANKIAMFLPYASEPCLTLLAEQVIATGGAVALPTFRGGFASVSRVNEIYATHTWYKTTSGKEVVDYTMIDLMVVPGIAFTSDGKRLGRGSGWYDRTIAMCRQQNPGVFVIGVCFSQQIVATLPIDYHDQLMDLVVYPKTLG